MYLWCVFVFVLYVLVCCGDFVVVIDVVCGVWCVCCVYLVCACMVYMCACVCVE